MTPFRKVAASVLLASGACGGCGTPRPSAAPQPATPPAGVRFEEIARDAGLSGGSLRLPQPLTILDAFGTGCAVFDFDDDGRQDLLFVREPHPALYRNLGQLKFQEVTREAGLATLSGNWKGCAVGDIDGDGRLDLLLTGYRCLALLRNSGSRFENVSAARGLKAGERWSAGAGFMDLDGDQDLDLVLLNYVRFGAGDTRVCEPKPGIRAGCPPRYYLPQFPEVWENTGGSFRMAGERSGMKEATGTAQVLAFADVEGDGDQDFFAGNDGSPSDLMLNQGGLRFRNAGVESGVAYGEDGGAIAAMFADFQDYDGDGNWDLFVTAFSGESYSLLRGNGKGGFEHAGRAAGLSEPTRVPLGFGSAWLDMDNDSWLDLVVANGHVYERAAEIFTGTTFRQPMMFFQSRSGRTFEDLTPGLGGRVAEPILGRGLARGDLDNDGRLDVVCVDYGTGPRLLHNRATTPGHWLLLDLRSPGKNRRAYGAQVEAQAGDRRWIAQVSPAGSYLSSNDPRVHLGLGTADRLDRLTVRWPSGKTSTLAGVDVDRLLRLEEPAAP